MLNQQLQVACWSETAAIFEVNACFGMVLRFMRLSGLAPLCFPSLVRENKGAKALSMMEDTEALSPDIPWNNIWLFQVVK